MTTVIEHFIKRFEGKDVDEFMFNIKSEISQVEEMICEWEESGVDELSIENMEDYIQDIMKTHKLYKGIMTYVEVSELVKFAEKKGVQIDTIFTYVEVNKANFELVKDTLFESCFSVSDAYTDEEIEKEEEMRKACLELKTIKALKQFIEDYEITELYGIRIWNKHLVDFMEKY